MLKNVLEHPKVHWKNVLESPKNVEKKLKKNGKNGKTLKKPSRKITWKNP